MAFNSANWGVISSSGNTQQRTLQDGTVIGAPGIYTYQSVLESVAVISAVDYFAPVDVNLAVGDLIYIIASDIAEWFNVLQVDVETRNVIIGLNPSIGDVTGPAVAVDNAPVVWDGTTGKLIKVGTITNQTSTPKALAAYGRYVANFATLLTFTMPATVPLGTEFEIIGQGAGGWLLQMNTGQVANVGNVPTSSAGSLASTNRYDRIKVVCTVANTTFSVVPNGSITVA